MLSQVLVNAIQKHSRQKWVDQAKYHAVYLIRQLVLRFHNPTIRYRIGQNRMYFPLSSDLPFITHKYPAYATNIARIAKQVLEKYPSLTLIDVGAYVGDTVAILRQEAQFPILCIEGNKRFFRLLKKNMASVSDVECLDAFINRPDFRTKSDGSLPSPSGIGLAEVLQRYPKFARSKILKIDTDGYDGIILRNAAEFLSTVKPILFFEYDPDLLAQHGEDEDSLWAMLRTLGYKMALFYENIGNYILSTDLGNTRLLKELHQWLSGYGGHRYFDVCLFPNGDLDLGERIRQNELSYFHTLHYYP